MIAGANDTKLYNLTDSECPNQTNYTAEYLFINGTKELKGDSTRRLSIVGDMFWGNYIQDEDDYYKRKYTKVCISSNQDRKTRGIMAKVNDKKHWRGALDKTISSEILEDQSLKK